jgi:hypothetical protein
MVKDAKHFIVIMGVLLLLLWLSTMCRSGYGTFTAPCPEPNTDVTCRYNIPAPR